VPSIQIDLPLTTTATTKQALAERVGGIYAEIMQVGKDILTVSVHDLGEGGVWRCHDAGPATPSALIMCDVRRGRSPETRAHLAQSLIDACVETFQLEACWVKVEFTQHAGDEMYHPHLGGFNTDWSGDERPATADSA
jgi:phenylpyruvate tautomerase PptA (4-oxalocrotonate tautomerase family)